MCHPVTTPVRGGPGSGSSQWGAVGGAAPEGADWAVAGTPKSKFPTCCPKDRITRHPLPAPLVAALLLSHCLPLQIYAAVQPTEAGYTAIVSVPGETLPRGFVPKLHW